jgi:hypothetical protein
MGRRRDREPDLFGWADERAAETAERVLEAARKAYRLAPHGEREVRMRNMRAALRTALQARIRTMGGPHG